MLAQQVILCVFVCVRTLACERLCVYICWYVSVFVCLSLNVSVCLLCCVLLSFLGYVYVGVYEFGNTRGFQNKDKIWEILTGTT